MFGNDVVVEFASLVGFAALVAIIINTLKFFKVVTDGTATKWSAGMNLVGLVALLVYRVFICQACEITGVDNALATVANVLSYVLALIVQLGVSKLSHEAAKGVPVIGTSFTLKRAQAKGIK